jgi:hypothetical protein
MHPQSGEPWPCQQCFPEFDAGEALALQEMDEDWQDDCDDETMAHEVDVLVESVKAVLAVRGSAGTESLEDVLDVLKGSSVHRRTSIWLSLVGMQLLGATCFGTPPWISPGLATLMRAAAVSGAPFATLVSEYGADITQSQDQPEVVAARVLNNTPRTEEFPSVFVILVLLGLRFLAEP